MAYFTNPDGIRFSYQDHGPADGRAVLLVSSWSFDATMWEYQVPALVAAGSRCVAMDRRGHARSDEPGVGYDLDTLADDLARLVAHLELTELSVVAHSMGCCETVRALRRHGTAGVRRAVLSARSRRTSAAWSAPRLRRGARRAARRPPGVVRHPSRRLLRAPASGVSAALVDDAMGVALRVPMEVLVACQRAGTPPTSAPISPPSTSRPC